MESALLIELTGLKECHSHLEADFFSFFFFSERLLCFSVLFELS